MRRGIKKSGGVTESGPVTFNCAPTPIRKTETRNKNPLRAPNQKHVQQHIALCIFQNSDSAISTEACLREGLKPRVPVTGNV